MSLSLSLPFFLFVFIIHSVFRFFPSFFFFTHFTRIHAPFFSINFFHLSFCVDFVFICIAFGFCLFGRDHGASFWSIVYFHCVYNFATTFFPPRSLALNKLYIHRINKMSRQKFVCWVFFSYTFSPTGIALFCSVMLVLGKYWRRKKNTYVFLRLKINPKSVDKK